MALDDDDRFYAEQRVLGLDPHTRRVLLARSIARIVGITVAMLLAYFAAPIGQDGDAVGLTVLFLGLAAFVGLVAFQVVRIVNSPAPQLRAAEALATVVPLVIVVFATLYVGGDQPDDVVRHIDHAINVMGEDAVSLGSDFDGMIPLPRGMRDVRDLHLLTEAMQRRGWPERRIEKVLGENWRRFFSETLDGRR